MSCLGSAATGLPDYPGHVVVGVGVADRAGDGRGLLTGQTGLADDVAQRLRCLPESVGGLGELARGLLIHVGKCRTFKGYGHDPSIRDIFVV